MGRRAWSPSSETDAEKLTIAELNTRIAAAKWAFDAVDNAAKRKGSFKNLCELEQLREILHGVPAPEHKQGARQK